MFSVTRLDAQHARAGTPKAAIESENRKHTTLEQINLIERTKYN